ncbi:hypothetical protein [Streptosporangium sp. NPDC000396]|uniref:hypothetical protein n=1 Tax=Streptosporangium sp. NPDC000396 TaxID=3366185 RepID=UPI0036C7EBEA
MNTSRWPTLLLAVSGWLALLATQAAGGGVLRVAVSLIFLLTCPGAAVLALVHPFLGPRDHTGDAMESMALTLAISVALGIIVSEAFFLSGTFTMPAAMATLAAITSAAALGSLLTARRARRGPAGRARK